jgi:hypothetical protein
VLAAGALLAGLAWRAHHILFAHPAGDYVYSDMAGYHRAAELFLDPAYRQGIADSLFPPGAGYLFAALHRLDLRLGSGAAATRAAMLAMSVALPLVLSALARVLYGRGAALLVLGMASLYFPFIDLFAWYLAEGPFMLAGSAAILVLVLAIRARRGAVALALGAASGALCAAAAAIKVVALAWLPAAVLLLAAWAMARRGSGLLRIAAVFLVAGLALLAPLAVRCTRLAGNFCAVSTNGPMNLVLGRAPPDAIVAWRDAAPGSRLGFSAPSETPLAERPRLPLDFAAWDGPANLRYALAQARSRPLEFLGRSLAQVGRLFRPSVPWPSGATRWRRTSIVYERWALCFVVLPALVSLLRRARMLARLRPEAAPELLLLLPLACQIAAALVTIGEARHRIALDGFLAILAAVELLRWMGIEARREPLVVDASE